MTEEQLCAEFIIAARADGWMVYPEQGIWDILIERRGVQVGIQAKLHWCINLLCQATADSDEGPQYRAVLLPQHVCTATANTWLAVAKRLKLILLTRPNEHHRTWGDNS